MTGQGDRVDPNVMIFITDGDDTTGHSDTEIATASAATGAASSDISCTEALQ